MSNATPKPMRRKQPAARKPKSDLASLLVPPAMLIVAIAMGLASHLHLGFAPEMAIAVGAGLFCAMLILHILLRAAEDADSAEELAAAEATAQVSSPMPPAEPAPVDGAEFGRGLGALASRDDDLQPLASTEPSVTLPPDVPLSAPIQEVAPRDGRLEAPLPSPLPPLAETTRVVGLDGGPAVPPAPAAWSFRPTEMHASVEPAQPVAAAHPTLQQLQPAAALDVPLPSAETMSDAVVAAIGALRPTLADAAVPAQHQTSEVDRIDSILKRLAQQIRAGTPPAPAAAGPLPELSTPGLSLPGAAAPSQAPDPAPLPALLLEPEAFSQAAAANPDVALSSAVDALRSTVEAMRHGAPAEADAPADVPGTAVTSATPTAEATVAPTAPPSPVELRLAGIAEALAAERVDVVLSPILGLAEGEAHHFEVSVRLRDSQGGYYEPDRELRGAGLLPLLDALSIRHAAGFALKLSSRGRAGAVFSEIAGESLGSETFVGDVSGRYAQGVADRMVLSFAQAEVRGLGPAQFAALSDLAALGFRFALTGIADLDMDFDALSSTGFQFAKLDASVFMNGLPCGGEMVPASDLSLHLADLGLATIVTGIADEDLRDALLRCGVAYGQGTLYGEPRPIPFTAQGAIAA